MLFRSKTTWESQIDQMVSFCKNTVLLNEQLGTRIWDSLSVLREYVGKKDSVKFSDVAEELIPSLYEAMDLRGMIDVEEDGYRFFSSKSGFLSLEYTKMNLSMLSATDPAMEAYDKASVMCDPGKKVFCTLGCELGYLAWQMYEVSDRSMDIFIYETDKKKIEYAKSYGVLDWIDSDKLHITILEDPKKLFNDMLDRHLTPIEEQHTSFYIEGDLFEQLTGVERDMATEILQNVGTELNFGGLIERNFYLNYKNVSKTVADIDSSLLSNKWIVVGGGPSVDYNIDYLKERKGSSVIIAASTILKRLLNEGVKPDYVVAIDMFSKLYKHMEGIEDTDIPLIMSDFVNWRFGKKYLGEKFLIPTEGRFFSKYIYKAAKTEPWNAPSTVTTAAIEVAIGLGAKSIDLVGVDLAFPGGYSHADGTVDHKKISKNTCIKVPAVNGGMVETSLILKAFLSEIERMIKANPGVTFHNKSQYGALIKGCI